MKAKEFKTIFTESVAPTCLLQYSLIQDYDEYHQMYMGLNFLVDFYTLYSQKHWRDFLLHLINAWYSCDIDLFCLHCTCTVRYLYCTIPSCAYFWIITFTENLRYLTWFDESEMGSLCSSPVSGAFFHWLKQLWGNVGRGLFQVFLLSANINSLWW